MLAAKTISKSKSDDTATKLLLDTAISNIEAENTTQKEFFFETLMQFDQIMRTTTIDVWKHYNRKTLQTTAMNNLKAKITAFETIRATAATAAAITKATENLQETESRNIQDNLRITNLEKSFKRQENKTNELANTLNKNYKNKTKNLKRKNSYGSHLPEPMASPNKTAPCSTNENSASHLVDLTTEHETLSQNPDSVILSLPYATKTSKRHKKRGQLAPQAKQISTMEKQGGQSLQSRSPRIKRAPKSTHDEPTKLWLQSTHKLSNLPTSSNPPSAARSLYEPLLQPAAEHLQLRSTQPFSTKSKPDGKSFPFKRHSQKKHKLPQKGSKQTTSKPSTALKRKPSRRIIQRRAKHHKQAILLEQDRPMIQNAYHVKQDCLKTFGFQANANLSLRQNFDVTLKNIKNNPLHDPTNLTFHNLCQETKLPTGTKTLLGLNFKYCLSHSIINQDINRSLLKMAYSIHTKYHLDAIGYTGESSYGKQIYAKNCNWNPDPAPPPIEDKITEFEKALKEELQKTMLKNHGKNLSNLTPQQSQILNLLKNNKQLIIKPTDKNLGPAIMDSEIYIKQVLKEHFLTKDYRQLTKQEAKYMLEKFKNTLQKLVNENQNLLTKTELTFFKRKMHQFHRTSIFYGLPKAHKTPITLRPVVSGLNSLSAIFSTWLDFKMKTLLPYVQSYIKNSVEVIKDLKALQIPKGALLFSADATSMYTNIDTNLGIASIRDFITAHQSKLPANIPSNFFLLVLTLIMKRNIFTFGDSYWLRLAGTAMGTHVACSYATVTFGQYENVKVIPTFKPSLIYYKGYIDDVIGIWLPPIRNQASTWNNFKNLLSSWGSLKRTVEDPSTSINFLDLNIRIEGSSITTSTFQKPLNLYLYIPPLSAHPPSCFKGLIYGELKRYRAQNSPADFENILAKFILRLSKRGHSLEKLSPLLLQAAAMLDCQHTTLTPRNTDNHSTLFIHWPFHPYGIQRQTIRRIFNEILQPYIPFNKMQVAISQPKNLRDILIRAALSLPDNLSLDAMIAQQTRENSAKSLQQRQSTSSQANNSLV